MSVCKSIIIDGLEYKAAASVDNRDIRIVILQRGHVMVGFYSQDGSLCSLSKASVIRKWGTTKGLGEIAQGGPTENTKLDPTNGLVEFNALTVIATIRCSVDKWLSKLT